MSGPRSDDRGFILIPALLFLTAIAFVAISVISFIESGLNGGRILANNRQATLSADSAVEAAINTVLANQALGTPGSAQVTTTKTVSTSGGTNYSFTYNVTYTGLVAPILQRNVVFTATCTAGPCPNSGILVRAAVSFYTPFAGGASSARVTAWDEAYGQ
jgi:Tfp pilus assembly protein PilX